MTNYLFTIGLGVEEAPERWTAICAIYGRLARGLDRLGHSSSFLVNPKAFDQRALQAFDAVPGDHGTLREMIGRHRMDAGFVWGGRIAADRETVGILREYGVRPIFSELGWFPQKGTIYFDDTGTNSEIGKLVSKKLPLWRQLQFSIKRKAMCKKIYGRALHVGSESGVAKRVFVPLQDEMDTNITLDSPFSTMDQMVGFLSRRYPGCQFVVRHHPKALPAFVDSYPNVEIQSAKTNLYISMLDFDAVVGINSTVLSEAALLGHPVFCFGDGIASRFGLAKGLEPDNPPESLEIMPETAEIRDALAYLIQYKQLDQKRLSSPGYLKKSYLNELLDL
ncbi:hypothetical protein [Poseidonocella sp. HB161398]|uniref:capsular polysaccharide export protein, LipB/KpsS family n=1 Tax=Poseidonocella sp. HB161398 TaxID=2320855 RepID=UPI0011093BC5|nr:hypothetical protein [Poseidonocella sp. HB161398]